MKALLTERHRAFRYRAMGLRYERVSYLGLPNNSGDIMRRCVILSFASRSSRVRVERFMKGCAMVLWSKFGFHGMNSDDSL